MTGERGTEWWLLAPPGLRRLPADLAAVVAVVVLVNVVVFLPVLNETPLRVIIGLPFVLFIPGYAFIAALFPEAGGPPVDGGGEETVAPDDGADASETDQSATRPLADRGIDGIERVALSFGLSIAVVPLIGLVLNFTPWGIRLVPIMVATSAFTLGATWAGARRRWALPPDDRFRVPYRTWLDSARSELFEPESRTDAALNVLLVVSILLAVSSVAFAVAVPKQGESFTEFYLLTETEDGGLVADDYPTEFVAGEGRELVVGIGNQEHQPVNFTVVVKLQRVEIERDTQRETAPENASTPGNVTSVEIREEKELGRFRTRLDHNETLNQPYTVQPTLVGDRMRLVFLLYRDAPPTEPGVENAYRETHLWVNVTEGEAGG